MSQNIAGSTRGLAPSEIRRIERLFARKLDRDELVSLELAREIYNVAHDLKRRIGVLISREGHVEEVIVGSREILYLPDLGRYRLGQARLRRLRLIFSDLQESSEEAHIPHDIYTDLEKLRFDMVVAVKHRDNRTRIAYAHLIPVQRAAEPAVRTELVADLGRLNFDFGEFMQNLEGELTSATVTVARGKGPRAVLVGVYEKKQRDFESSIEELRELARSAGVEVADTIIQRRELDPRTLLGKGKLEEVVLQCLRLSADIIIFDTELRPSQWRVITNATELKVLDRSMLILDIFAQRAKSSDGRLQVELAQLKYNLPRLVEMDAGLSRLSGGIGGRGPGETKLEIGRRRARDRISDLEKRIDKLGEQRQLRRKRRQEGGLPLVAIVGYTNVGKSTLFNELTKSMVTSEDKLFATLDPAQRRVTIPIDYGEGMVGHRTFILSDTVGFIRNLPAELMSAFRSTLEELRDAVLFVHVLDASDPEIQARRAAVEKVIEEMELTDIPTVIVLNKIDRADPNVLAGLEREMDGISVSALHRQGLSSLMAKIAQHLFPEGRASIAAPGQSSGINET